MAQQAHRLRRERCSHEAEATWGIYQRMIAAYREPDRARGRQLMSALIASVSAGVPAALSEVSKLGLTLSKRAADVLAYFCRQRSNMRPIRRSKTRPPVRRVLVCRVLGSDAGQGVDPAVA